MDLFDVNIYVNAFNEDSPHHRLCYDLLKSSVESGRNFGYSPLAISGFIRIVTHPRILESPADISAALDFSSCLTESPNAISILPGKTHYTLFNHICRRYALSGNDIPDAFFAALAMEADCNWITLDKGFRQFTDLRLQIIS